MKKPQTVRIRAKRVRKGDTFMMFMEECFVVKTDRNEFGQTVIRFTMHVRNDSRVNHIVIDPETYFDVKTN